METRGKSEQTIPYFRTTRVSSCADIVRRGGHFFALPFTASKQKADDEKLLERRSMAHEAYQVRQNLHLGMRTKPLERYTPTAFRSRMRTEDYVMPYKNSSSIVLGDRSQKAAKHFVTTSQNFMQKPRTTYTTNAGILSEITRRQHAHEWS
jgi:hypothetical protein